VSAPEIKTPYCYCRCCVLSSFSNEICVHYSLVETIAIDLNHFLNLRNGLNLCSSIFVKKSDLTKNYICYSISARHPQWGSQLGGWPTVREGDTKTLQWGSLHTDVMCTAAGPGPADTCEHSHFSNAYRVSSHNKLWNSFLCNCGWIIPFWSDLWYQHRWNL